MLAEKYGSGVKDELIPEFPVHIGTIYPQVRTDKSFKIDYVAFAEDDSKVFFVELKTDRGSRREKQDDYLDAAAGVGMTRLLEGLVKIFTATKAKRKYYHLFEMLESVGVLTLPIGLQDKVFSRNMRGVNALISEIAVVRQIPESKIVYVQPTGEAENVITFDEFARMVNRFDDPAIQRFAQSLGKWGTTEAGDTQV